MAYAVKYILQFTSDRGNEVRIEVLKKDYQGEVIYKSLGGSPSLSIEQGDGAIKGSSLVFAMQADIEGELQELYTTDNKQFKVNMYRNEVLSWQGYILPELYSEEYVDAPYDVSVTATDQLATLKAITYQREDVNVSLSIIIEDILLFTQISVPVTYHQNLSAHRKGGVPMLVDSHISQAAYNGHSCYDVLNNILLSCNCCIMQINGEWLITSLTNSTTNYYTAGVTQVREHKALGQLGVGEVCPAGTLTMVNNPALKGARVEYAHMLRHSFLVNADCVDREGWNYTPDSRNPIDIPGEREAFGKIFKAYCWELHPVNIRENNSLQLWQEVSLEKDERNYYDLSVKTLFGTNAKLLLMAVTYLGSDGVERRLTSEGWIETWDKSDVNYYIQITGTNKNAGLDAIADIEQYEMSTVQFALPPVDGTMRVGFINSTTDYAEPLASAPIYVSQVYLTVSGVTGQECTTEVEPNATQEQQDVLLAYGDTFESENAYKLGLNTLKKSSGENITSWWLDNVNFSSYYDTMLQEFSRYFGVKKAQLQGIIMGKDVLSDMYADVFSGRVMRLLSAQVDLLADEASVTVEEVITTTVDFDTVIYATNNTNSFGSSSGGGAGTSGGASSTAGESLLGVQSDGDVYVKDGRALVGSEARFEKMALPSSAPDKRAEQKTYIYSSDTSRGAIDIAKIAKYIEEQAKIWVLDSANGVVRTQYNVVSTQEIISGRRASGASTDVGGGGISSITAQMIADALGYVPYSSANPAGYINSSALEQYVTSRGYITADALTKANVGLGEVQNYGVFNQTSFKGKTQYAIVNSSVLEIANRIDFHVNESTADYEVSLRVASGETTKRVIYLPSAEGTLALVSQIPTIPTALKSPYALTFGTKTYDGSEAKTITAADLGALSTGGGTISKSSYMPLVIENTASDVSVILYKGASGDLGYLGFNGASNPVYMAPSGYAYTLIHTGNFADTTDKRYLQLSGGAIDGAAISPLSINTSATREIGLSLKMSGKSVAWVGYTPNVGVHLYSYGNGNGVTHKLGLSDAGVGFLDSNTLIHSGNIGSQSVNSARKLYYIGTVPSSGFDANIALSGGGRMSNYASGGWWGSTMPAMSYGTIYQLQGDDTGNDLAGQLAWDVNHRSADSTRNLWWRANDDTNFSNAKWHQIAFTDSNVASATKLQAARTIWGRSFDGTADVWGGIDVDGYKDTNSITKVADLGTRGLVINAASIRTNWGMCFWTEGNGRGMIQQQAFTSAATTYPICLQPFGGNVLVGTTTDAGYKFAVNGGALANTVRTQELRLGEASPGGSVTQNKWYHATIGYVYEDASPNTLKPAIVFKSMYDTYSEGSGNELMRIRANGNVLIGTTADKGFKLQVNGASRFEISSDNLLLLEPATNSLDGSGIAFWSSGGWKKGTINASTLYLNSGSGGNVLIGTTTDSGYKLDVNGTSVVRDKAAFRHTILADRYNGQGNTAGAALIVNKGGDYFGVGASSSNISNISLGWVNDLEGTWKKELVTINASNNIILNQGVYISATDSANTARGILELTTSQSRFIIGYGVASAGYNTSLQGNNIEFAYGTSHTVGMKLTSSGNVEMYGNLTATGEVISSRRASSSDRRLKNNITYLDTTDCLAMVRRIRPAEWDWKDNGKHSMGFIAQDVEHLMPYAVTSVRDNMLGYKMNLQYDQFIALAIGGVQAVDSEVQQLKKEVKELKEKLAKYEHNGNYRN